MRILTFPLLLAISVPAMASAQMMVQPLPGSSDADLLAATMRRVAANPLDVDALLTAGEQSLRVDDLSGAASLFARAEKIDPRNGRVKAGMASILVRSERPGEALRYFAQAAASGLDARRFAADRGFAYDLVGDQPRAQADYRVALANGADDETMRRYALSLGISGRGDEALRQLQPLLGRSDRAAWRARAFILAMTGDQPGAERIAATMMPAGMAAGLRPFFERLPSLPAVDRAFAVHFGEVRPTPERIADARFAPVLPPLPPEARPVQVAAATSSTRRETGSERRRRERDERRAARERVALAARDQRTRPGRVTLASTVSVPPAAAVTPPPVQVAALSVPRIPAASLPPTARVTPPPVQVASLAGRSGVTPLASSAPLPSPGFSGAPYIAPPVASTAPSVAASSFTAPTGSLPAPGFTGVATAGIVPDPAASSSAAQGQPAFVAPVAVAARVPVPAAPGTEVGLAPLVAASSPVIAPSPADVATRMVAIAPGGTAPVEVPSRNARVPAADSVLARIVASLSIPAAELGVGAPVRVAPPRVVPLSGAVSEGAARTAEALRTKAARDAEADAIAQRIARNAAAAAAGPRRARRGAVEPAEVELAAAEVKPLRTARERRAAAALAAKAKTDAAAAEAVEVAATEARPPRNARERRAAAALAAKAEAATAAPATGKRGDPKKAVADRKAAAEKKEAADQAAEERRASRTSPSRIWVQVAGGANASDLPKAWAATKAKAPAVLASRPAYAAKLRATNRVVTGPFKTDAEARAFVNQLAKSGVSAFPFKSDAGEAVTRLPGK